MSQRFTMRDILVLLLASPLLAAASEQDAHRREAQPWAKPRQDDDSMLRARREIGALLAGQFHQANVVRSASVIPSAFLSNSISNFSPAQTAASPPAAAAANLIEIMMGPTGSATATFSLTTPPAQASLALDSFQNGQPQPPPPPVAVNVANSNGVPFQPMPLVPGVTVPSQGQTLAQPMPLVPGVTVPNQGQTLAGAGATPAPQPLSTVTVDPVGGSGAANPGVPGMLGLPNSFTSTITIPPPPAGVPNGGNGVTAGGLGSTITMGMAGNGNLGPAPSGQPPSTITVDVGGNGGNGNLGLPAAASGQPPSTITVDVGGNGGNGGNGNVGLGQPPAAGQPPSTVTVDVGGNGGNGNAGLGQPPAAGQPPSTVTVDVGGNGGNGNAGLGQPPAAGQPPSTVTVDVGGNGGNGNIGNPTVVPGAGAPQGVAGAQGPAACTCQCSCPAGSFPMNAMAAPLGMGSMVPPPALPSTTLATSASAAPGNVAIGLSSAPSLVSVQTGIGGASPAAPPLADMSAPAAVPPVPSVSKLTVSGGGVVPLATEVTEPVLKRGKL